MPLMTVGRFAARAEPNTSFCFEANCQLSPQLAQPQRPQRIIHVAMILAASFTINQT